MVTRGFYRGRHNSHPTRAVVAPVRSRGQDAATPACKTAYPRTDSHRVYAVFARINAIGKRASANWFPIGFTGLLHRAHAHRREYVKPVRSGRLAYAGYFWLGIKIDGDAKYRYFLAASVKNSPTARQRSLSRDYSMSRSCRGWGRGGGGARGTHFPPEIYIYYAFLRELSVQASRRCNWNMLF